MARHQASGSGMQGSEHVRPTGPRDGSSPRRDALAPPPQIARSRPKRAWIGLGAASAVLLLLIIFIAQNTARADVSFLGLSGSLPLAAALLAAALAGAVLTAVVGLTRLRRARD
jgi:uncharacterized integral membrane protein